MHYVQISKALKTGILTLGLMTSAVALVDGMYSQGLASDDESTFEENEIKKNENEVYTTLNNEIKNDEIKQEFKYDPNSILKRILENPTLKKLQLPSLYSIETSKDLEEDRIKRKNSFVETIELYKKHKGIQNINKIFLNIREHFNGETDLKDVINACINEIINAAKIYDSKVEILKTKDEKRTKTESILSKINDSRLNIIFYFRLSIEFNNYALRFIETTKYYESIVKNYELNKISMSGDLFNLNENYTTIIDDFSNSLEIGKSITNKDKKMEEGDSELIEKLKKEGANHFSDQSELINNDIETLKNSTNDLLKKFQKNLIELFSDYSDSWIFGGFSRSTLPVDPILLDFVHFNSSSQSLVSKKIKLKIDEINREIESFNNDDKITKENKENKLSMALFEILEIRVD